jgi:hypothetical protein
MFLYSLQCQLSIQLLHNQTNNQVSETPMSRDGVNVYVGELGVGE